MPSLAVRPWRKHRGLNQTQLAERIGVSVSNLSRLERGGQAVEPATLEALAKALDCDVSDFFLPFAPDSPAHQIVAALRRMSSADAEKLLSVVRLVLGQRAA